MSLSLTNAWILASLQGHLLLTTVCDVCLGLKGDETIQRFDATTFHLSYVILQVWVMRRASYYSTAAGHAHMCSLLMPAGGHGTAPRVIPSSLQAHRRFAVEMLGEMLARSTL